MKKLVNDWKNVALVGGIILLVAFLLRSLSLTSFPVFADEAIYIRWAQVMRAEPSLRFLPLSDGKQPLFMWAVIPLLKLFEDPLFAGRFLSVLSGIGTASGIFVFAYLLFKNKKVALVSMLMYAFSPYTVFFDRMALVDSMLSMFVIWVFIFILLSLRHLRLDTAMLGGFALGGAALTKSPALFSFLLLPIFSVFSDYPRNRSKLLVHCIKVASLIILSTVIGFTIYNILRLGPNFHLVNSRNLDYVFPLSHFFENPLNPFLANLDRALEWLMILGPETLILFVLFGVLANIRKYPREIAVLLALSFVPILIQSEFAKVFTARYIFFTIPYLITLAGSSFLVNFSTAGRKILMFFLGIFVIQALWSNYALITSPEAFRLPRNERAGYLEEWSAGTGIREAADYLLSEHDRDPNKPIVIGTEGYFGTLPDGLQIYLEGTSNMTVIGVGLDISQVPISLVESAVAGNKTYLVANSSRLKFAGEFSKFGLDELLKIKKANRPDGTFDYLYLFQINQPDNISIR